MAAPVWESGNATVAATTCVVTAPTGITTGDLLIAIGGCLSSATITAPAGFSAADVNDSDGTNRIYLWRRTADSTDEAAANYTFTISGSDYGSCSINRISGANTGAPTTTTGTGADQSQDCANITTPSDDCLVLWVATQTNEASTASSATRGTERIDVSHANGSHQLYSETITTAGAQTGCVITTTAFFTFRTLSVAIESGTPAATVEQEGFRWRNDNGSETTATWATTQDVHLLAPVDINYRLRTLLNTNNDVATTQYELRAKLSTDSLYVKVDSGAAGTIASVGTLGTGTSSTSNSSFSMTTATNTLTAGNTGILTIVSDNTSTGADGDNGEVTSVTGGTGVWTKLAEYTNTNGSAATGVTTSVWAFYATSDLGTGTSITINFGSNRTDKCCSFWAFSNTSKRPLTLQASSVQANATDASNGFGSVSFSSLSSVQRLYFRGLGKEANSTTNITASTSFSTITAARSRNNAAAVLVRGEFRINTSTGETSNPTLAVSGDTSGVFLALIEQPAPIILSASSNITASGENTTAQLDPPASKTTSDFVAGRMQDDENPADTVDITSSDYTEMEWCIKAVSGVATNGQIYQFRVYKSTGTVLNTYTVTPQWTIGIGMFLHILYPRRKGMAATISEANSSNYRR